jgi:uncharacterized protein YqhQ
MVGDGSLSGYAQPMDKLRLGGMALENGVLVHGPNVWAAAVRDREGAIHVASGRKRRFSVGGRLPVVRGPVRLAEAVAVLPAVRKALPQARFAFERPKVLAAMVGCSFAGAAVRRSRLGAVPRETLAAVASLVPAVLALRGGELASYHGAEHVSIGTYESGAPAAKEHERCGSHLLGPMLATSAAASVLAQRVPPRHRRGAQLAGAIGAVGVAVEIFGWSGRNPQRRLSRILARPGYELQHRLATAEPSPEQLEVAEAALAACLEAEAAHAAV